MKGIIAIFKGGLKIGVQMGAYGIGLTIAGAEGLEGEQAEAFAGTMAGLVNAATNTENTGASKAAKVQAEIDKAQTAAKDYNLALEAATYDQYKQGYELQGVNEDKTIASFTNERGQVHLVNLYNPVFNSVSDVEQTMEAIASSQAAAVAGGGKY